MSKASVETRSHGVVTPKTGSNSRTSYNHQKQAMESLNIIDRNSSYSTLVVLPTGGGKTYTASVWLLNHALNKHRKILWIAHRQMLLDQAAESFQKYAYASSLPNITSFRFRVVSGARAHDRTIDISPKDDLVIASKDSIGKNLEALDNWLKDEKELYLIVDEAHHSTAKTYRRIMEHVKALVPHVKLIGLTATPMRTAQEEQGLLARIYTDGVKNDKIVTGDIGITYQIGLKDLINRQILSKPVFESYYTDEEFGTGIGGEDWEKITRLDVLPDDISDQMAGSAMRNRLIVETYLKKQDTYGQTIVFAVNVVHAIALAKLFNNAGVAADYIVSDIRDMVTGVRISSEDNERKLKQFQEGELKVLVNVNILTEGVDLPQTKTVFLARPTVSTILMTQMIGRALRGVAAGGTEEAYIVTFVDDWKERIAWVNPESLYINSENEFSTDKSERQRKEIRMIAISKIEEFASLLDDAIDTTALERVPFEKRIPIGMYAFTYLEENGMDHSYQVMVYDSTKSAYEAMMDSLPELFESFGEQEEYPSKKSLEAMAEQCRDAFFLGEMIPPYEQRDMLHILKYYAQYETAPLFYSFEDIDKKKLDVSAIAKYIWDEDMGARKKAAYVDAIWENSDDNLLRLFFGRKTYFWKQLDIELMKLSDADLFREEKNVSFGRRQFEDMTLHEIQKYDPQYEKELRDAAFEAVRNPEGFYVCPVCGRTGKTRAWFQVDHIIPMNKGGKTVPQNLQVLCRSCNARKSDNV